MFEPIQTIYYLIIETSNDGMVVFGKFNKEWTIDEIQYIEEKCSGKSIQNILDVADEIDLKFKPNASIN